DGPRLGSRVTPGPLTSVRQRWRSGPFLVEELLMTMRSWMRNWFSRPVTRPIRKAPPRCRPTVEVLEERWVPSTIVVNNPTNTPVAGLIDLREALAMANTNVGDDTITFDPTVFNTARTITLGGTQLELTDTTGATTITGPSVGVTVSGDNASRVFQVD